MSKGLGHVGRAILAAFEDEPDNAFTTEELCERAYPRTAGHLFERKQRVAVQRAVKILMRHRPDLGLAAWREFMARGQPCAFYRQYNVLSYAMARLKAEEIWLRRRNKRTPEAQLRAELAPGGRHYEYVQPDGAWTLHTEMEIAKRDGDPEKLARLEAEQERMMGGAAERIRTAMAKVEQ
jgi:hypothetical protein